MKLVSFSFDDGGPADREVVRIFDRLHCRATFYLTSGLLLRSVYAMHQKDIVALYRAQEVGCHTRNHTSLTCRSVDDGAVAVSHVETEITSSGVELRSYFGVTQAVELFAYPYGDYAAGLFPVLEVSGFKYARSCERKDPRAVRHPQNRWAMPVSAMLGAKLPRGPEDFPESEGAIHLVGHALDIQERHQMRDLEALVDSFLHQGYLVVPNSALFSATLDLKGQP